MSWVKKIQLILLLHCDYNEIIVSFFLGIGESHGNVKDIMKSGFFPPIFLTASSHDGKNHGEVATSV